MIKRHDARGKNGTTDNEGDDFYLMQDFLDGKDDPKSKKK
jgi:hypothetical protein